MNIHRIIRDPELLQRFIDWLPALKHNERYYFCLQARKKYMPSLRASDKTQLKRFVAKKEAILKKIQQLECPVGCYTTKDGGVIEDEGIALYVTANPRDMRKATFNAAKSFIELIESHLDQKTGQFDLNPYSEALTQIHKAKARSVFVHFDVDRPTGDESDANANKSDLSLDLIYQTTVGIVGKEAVTIIQTRGGAHVLVEPGKVACDNKNWYPMIVKELNCDQTGDLMIPVVGCCQGGFVPRFYEP